MNQGIQREDISLNGEWNLYWCEVGKGSLEQAVTKAKTPCMVPGDVHTALIKEGIIKDPLIDANSKDCKWVEEQEFWYVKNFELKAEQLKDKVMITFGGLDLTSDIWVNGQLVGSHNNAFYEVSFDLTNIVREGNNLVVVRIDQGLESVKDKPMELMGKMWNNDQPYRVWMRKPQFVYGWDWTIWLATCGITRDVTITCYQQAYINDVYVYEDKDLNLKDGQVVTVHADISVEKILAGNYQLKCELYADHRYEEEDTKAERGFAKGKLISEQTLTLDSNKITIGFTLDSVNLWWPNGCGNPYLYHAEFTLLGEDGTILDRLERAHGVRSIRIREEQLNEEEQGFTFVVNEEPIFCKGANHVPSDCLYGTITAEHTRSLVQKAADSHMNMLRVWGGGIYESEAFMTACDELGLMVWHDFMYACGFYPDHVEEFYAELRKEAIAAILRLRNHSSLIGWSGNNESQEMYHTVKQWTPELPWYGRRIYEELLPEIVATYQTNVIYRESSPYGGKNLPCDFEIGDQHVWHFTHRPNYEHYMDIWRFTDFNLKFLSEFGVIGAMSMNSINKCISKKHQDVDSEVWLHHCNTSSEHQILNKVMETYFGDYHKYTLEEYVLRSQVIQAEITRHIYDEFRARKFVCSGLLFWTLGDSYGINNWSLIDYYLEEKPVYYYLKRSQAPLAIAVRGYDVQNFDGMKNYRDYFLGNPKPLTLWAINDKLQEEEVVMEYRLMNFAGEVIKQDSWMGVVAANCSQEVMTVPLEGLIQQPESTFLYVTMSKNGEVVNENKYLFAPFKELQLASAKVTCNIKKHMRGVFEVELTTDQFVWMLHLVKEDGVNYSDNDFDLIPGQKKRVFVKVDDLEMLIPVMNSINPTMEVIIKK
jgi:beta-mannosidase